MRNKAEKWAGTALVLSSVLMVVTMVLHPAGGSFAHLLTASPVIIGAHAVAIVSMPVGLAGFWGFAQHFKQEKELSRFAFSFVLFGLFAGLCAAAVNGLALPLFIRNYADATKEFTNTLSPILKYNTALNHAFDFIFIVAVCLAVVFWSVAIVKGKELPRWVGYYGLTLGALGMALLFSGVTLLDLHGFRLFIFGLVTWIIAIGFILKGQRTEPPHL